jgi:hypothetical protein
MDMAKTWLSRAFGPNLPRWIYQELCPGMLRSVRPPPEIPGRADDPVHCHHGRGCKADTRVAAAVGWHLARVLNDYDFGGYLIARDVAPFIDGRTELYGEKFFVDHNAASGLMEPENLFRLLEEYRIEATLMRTQDAATKLLDHIDG